MSRDAEAVPNDLMTAADAARILGLSADMVRLLARDGRLPAAASTIRGLRLFRREDVDALAAERRGARAPYHIAQFYEDDAFLVGAVADFLAEGLKSGGPLVVIATEARRQAVRERLIAGGFDVERASESGRLTFLDAAETLERFMVGGTPDAELFRKHVGAVVEARSHARVRLRIYGEMVDLLCRAGLVQAAVRFEELWNELARSHRLSRLCAYGIQNFRSGEESTLFQRICDLHHRVVPTERYSEDADTQTRRRQIAILQQQACALETEMRRRKLAEQELCRLRGTADLEDVQRGASQ